MANFYQCCFTNVTNADGASVRSGWQAVAVSPGIPTEARNACTRLQNINSSIKGVMKDEYGNVLDLLEIQGDGNFLYIVRSKYGSVDRLGRPNMFSHAYVMPWDNELLCDSNGFLTIDNANFASTEEEAMKERDSLSRMQSFELRAALKEAGLSQEGYLTLVRSVFAQMTERSLVEPVYVQFEGNERQMRALLYCLYQALPFFLRRKLGIASTASNGAGSKNVIFTLQAGRQRYHMDPTTGQNNVLIPQLLGRIVGYGFVDYVVQNELDEHEANEYFKRLETVAHDLGDKDSSEPALLKIAHRIIIGPSEVEYDDSQLREALGEALRLSGGMTQRMEQHVAAMLNEAINRKLTLVDRVEANLDAKGATATTPALKDAFERYIMFRFGDLPQDKAAEKLSRMGGDEFARYTNSLVKTAEGQQVLDYYFADYALSEEAVSWDAINRVLDDSAILSSHPRTLEKVDAAAGELYWSLLDESLADAVQNYNAYLNVMSYLYANDHSSFERCAAEARAGYWDRMTFDNIDLAHQEDLRTMDNHSIRAQMFTEFLGLLNDLPMQSDESLLQVVQQFFGRYASSMSRQDEMKALRQIQAQMRSCGKQSDPSFTRWIKIVSMVDSDRMCGLVLEMRSALYTRRFNMLVDAISEAKSASFGSDANKQALRKACSIMLDYCTHNDTEQTPVPLDVWLKLGEGLQLNPFQVFDRVRPTIIYEDPRTVVAASRLMKIPAYSDDANRYIDNHGNEARVVRRWLKAVKQMQKTSSSQTGTIIDRTLGSLFGQRKQPQEQSHMQRRPPEVESPFSSNASVHSQDSEVTQQGIPWQSGMPSESVMTRRPAKPPTFDLREEQRGIHSEQESVTTNQNGNEAENPDREMLDARTSPFSRWGKKGDKRARKRR